MFGLSTLELIIIGAHLALFVLFMLYIRHRAAVTKQKAMASKSPEEPSIAAAPKQETKREESIKPVEAPKAEPIQEERASEDTPPSEQADDIEAPREPEPLKEEPPIEAEPIHIPSPEEAEPEPEPAPPPPEAEPEKTVKEGLKKTREGFFSRITSLFSGKKTIERDTLEKLEEILFTADIGAKTADKLITFVKESLDKKELSDPAEVTRALKEKIREIISVETPPLNFSGRKPFTILILGVNGVGKTTTIGKLSEKFRREGKSVLLAAGDTFRAAAVEQLEIWAGRSQAEFVKGAPNADPSSVVFDAIKRAQAREIDLVLADTAGRLHTKVPLMEELKKIRRVMDKAYAGAPDEIWLVLDATTGQNAISQAGQFMQAMEKITGIIITKLDGTAKGGVIVGICEQFKLPVRYIGIGEKTEDLREFDAKEFAEALFSE